MVLKHEGTGKHVPIIVYSLWHEGAEAPFETNPRAWSHPKPVAGIKRADCLARRMAFEIAKDMGAKNPDYVITVGKA